MLMKQKTFFFAMTIFGDNEDPARQQRHLARVNVTAKSMAAFAALKHACVGGNPLYP